MSRIAREDLLEAPPGQLILRISLMVYSALFVVSFMGLVDAFFIARLGPDALAAFGFTLSTYGLMFGLATALGAGVRATVAQCIGRGDAAAGARTISAACIVAIPSFGALGLLGALGDQVVYRISGADTLHNDLASTFMLPVWCLAPAVGVTIVVTSALQAVGDLKASMWTIVAILPSNLVLSPIMMFGYGPFPRLGMLGAGIAAALSWVICGGLGVLFLAKRSFFGRITGAAQIREIMRPVLQVALPVSVSQLTIPLSMGMLTSIVSGLGAPAMAAFAALARITDFVIMGVNAVATGVLVVAGANVGAGKVERLPRVIGVGAALCFTWGTLCALVLMLGASPIAHAIAKDAQVSQLTARFLSTGSLNYAFFAPTLVMAAAMNGINRARTSLAMNLIAMFLIQLPILYIGTRHWGWPGYCVASTVGRIAALLLIVAWLRHDKLLDLRIRIRQVLRTEPSV